MRLQRCLYELSSLCRFAFHRRKLDQELDDEIAYHLDAKTEENIAKGMPHEEARRAAKIELGGVEQVKEKVRSVRTGVWLGTLVQDIRFGLRILRKNPAFACVAVLTLALGIGANTTVFTLIDALLLRQLPVQQPEQLVGLSMVHPNGARVPFSFPMLEELSQRQEVFSGVFGWYGNGMFNVQVGDALALNDVWAVTGNFYNELGASPLLGRLLVPSDADPSAGTASIAVLGYSFWQRRFNGDPSVIGRQILVQGQPFTIIGVTQKGFRAMNPAYGPDVTVPVTAIGLLTNGAIDLKETPRLWLTVTGRLKSGVTIAQALAQLKTFWPQVLLDTVPQNYSGEMRRQYVGSRIEVTSDATGEAGSLRSGYAEQLYILMAMVSLLLLGACLNLANLMLARSAAREHEIGVRVAVGASRWRLAQQMAIESLTLSGAGALLAIGIAYWASRTLLHFITQYYLVPVTLNMTPDLRILSMTSAAAVFTGLLCAVAPSWSAARQDPASMLQQNTRNIHGSAGKLGKTFIIAQVAVSIVILLAAGLLTRGLERLLSMNIGFQRDGVLLVNLEPQPGEYKNFDPDSYRREVIERVSSLAGVRAAGLANVSPGLRLSQSSSVSSSDSQQSTVLGARGGSISPGFFAALGISLSAGRGFTWTDDDHTPAVAIINTNLAARLFPAGNSLGQYIRIGNDPSLSHTRVVGVVNDGRLLDIRSPQGPGFYVPVLQDPKTRFFSPDLFVRVSGNMPGVTAGVRHIMDSLGHEYVIETRTVASFSEQVLLPERLMAIVAGSFATVALLLMLIGLYGLMSYAVARRTRELGIRMALGAQRGEILRSVLGESLLLTAAGITIGLPCGFAATRLLQSMLFGLSPLDLATLVLVVLSLIAVGMIAGYIPARRAMRVDPMIALRHD